jgi:hypothetical protein
VAIDQMTRRALLFMAAVAPLRAADDDWVSLFDGRSLDGWRPSEHKDAWKIVDGRIAADGARSHLFYNGPVHAANFKNFELEVDALARPGCNSGVYFHTAYQETGFPIKGFEIQINNTALGEGTYRERKKTGSLYGLRNVYMQLIPDDQWFKIRAAVRGKNVQIRLNDTLVVDYTEPTPPVIPAGAERERFLDRGTFALQCHNDGSKALFRTVRVRPLPDDEPTPGGPAPEVDDTFRRIVDVGRSNFPMVDYHVHLARGFTLDRALAKSRRDGIQYGIAVKCGKGFPRAERCLRAQVRREYEGAAGLHRHAGRGARMDAHVFAVRRRPVRLHRREPGARRSGRRSRCTAVHGDPGGADCGHSGKGADRYLCQPDVSAGRHR